MASKNMQHVLQMRAIMAGRQQQVAFSFEDTPAARAMRRERLISAPTACSCGECYRLLDKPCKSRSYNL